MAVQLSTSSEAAGWSIAPLPVPQRQARSLAAAGDLPTFLSDPTRFVVTDQFDARLAASRSSGSLADLQFEVDASDGQPRIVVARFSSGAVTFHLPWTPPGGMARTGRGVVRGGRRQAFTLSPPGGAPLGVIGRRDLLGTLIRIVVVKTVNVVARLALPVLARQLEQRLWRDAGRKEGWVQVTDNGLAAGQLEHAAPNVPAGQSALLLIHGTFSHTLSAFGDWLRSPAMAVLRAQYGPRIYAVDHFTISKSPDDNVADLLNGLAGAGGGTFDCVTHSRGGLVIRSLAATNKIRLGRVVQVASPNLGTPLATPERYEQTLGWFANLLELFPTNPYTTAAAWISESLSWLAQSIVGALPGLSSMDANGPVVAGLRGSPAVPAAKHWHALTANYQPPDDHWAQRLLDMGVDSFFQEANDLVVPTEGGWRFDAQPENCLPATQVACFGPGGNLATSGDPVHHINFFSHADAQLVLQKALSGLPLELQPVGTLARSRSVLPSTPSIAASSVPAVAGIAPTTAGPSDKRSISVDPAITGIAGEGWANPAALHLMVLPIVEESGGYSRDTAQLLAIYGSARVFASFRLRGESESAGKNWHKIISFQKQINDYAEGLSTTLTPADMRAGGQVMFDVLFQKEVRRLYDQARFRHDRRKLNVVFTSMIPWVADFPWEFAFDPSCQTFLSTSDVRFVRNVLTPVPADNMDTPVRVLRILVVSSQPGGTVPLSEAEEEELIRRSFRSLIDRGLAKVDVLARATPSRLHGRVQSQQYDVVHFIGHGEFNDETQTGYLVFEDQHGGMAKIDTDQARQILRSRGIRLVFLNACQTGRGGRADYNKGVAPGLVSDGVPAVVANQYSVLDRSATMFAKHFYGCLVQGLSLGDAMRESRIALNYMIGTGMDWAVPVLFARNPDAILCKPTGGRQDIDPFDADFAEDRSPTFCSRDIARDIQANCNARRIAVWDVADSIPGLEHTLEAMNVSQNVYRFELVNLTAPFGTWKTDTSQNGTLYLSADRVASKLSATASGMGVDLLLCITDLPMADESTLNLYLWVDPEPASTKNTRVALFSIWGFDPAMLGAHLPAAIANAAVQTLASVYGGNPPARPPKGSIGHFNPNRDIEGVIGRLTIDSASRKALETKMTQAEIAALEILLRLFHLDEAVINPDSRPSPLKSKSIPKRSSRRKPKISSIQKKHRSKGT